MKTTCNADTLVILDENRNQIVWFPSRCLYEINLLDDGRLQIGYFDEDKIRLLPDEYMATDIIDCLIWRIGKFSVEAKTFDYSK